MKTLTIGLVLLLAILVVALADIRPHGRDHALIQVGVATARVDVTMKTLTIGLVLLLAILVVALADIRPHGRDHALIQVGVATARVDVTAPAAVETEVAAVARSGSRHLARAARPLRLAGGSACPTMPLKRWRAWNAG